MEGLEEIMAVRGLQNPESWRICPGQNQQFALSISSDGVCLRKRAEAGSKKNLEGIWVSTWSRNFHFYRKYTVNKSETLRDRQKANGKVSKARYLRKES